MIKKFGEVDFRVEENLDESIQFLHPISANWKDPKGVLLTGASGFLGSFLLKEILNKTMAYVYCLVRSETIEGAIERLKTQFQTHSYWNENFDFRVIPLLGDLSLPFFGLEEQKFEDLAAEVDIIYHSGAYVNFTRPYSTLKPSNVNGTIEILRCANLVKTKPVHFVSTLAVFPSQDNYQNPILETDIPNASLIQGGLRQSKFVAEELVQQARRRGLPATIHRAVRITGHSKTGVTSNFDDLMCRILKACILTKKFPDLDMPVTLVTVDYISQAMVFFSQQDQFWGKNFHYSHPHPINWNDFLGMLVSLGYSLKKIPYQNWLKEIQEFGSSHPEKDWFTRLLFTLKMPNFFFAKKTLFDPSWTNSFLSKVGIKYPPIDVELLENYLSYFYEKDFLPPRDLVGGVYSPDDRKRTLSP